MKTSIIAEKANRRLARPRLKTKTVDLNAFWDVVMDLLKGGALAKTCFKLINRRIYFMSHEVAAAAATGIKDLTREDLRRALQAEKYWVPGKYKQRFGEKGNKAIESCWCVEVLLNESGKLLDLAALLSPKKLESPFGPEPD